MSIIYEPTGKAREYSPLAANLYLGCNHKCKYCYAPNIQFKKREDYCNPEPRRNLLREFEIDCKKFYNSDRQVLFCFMTDPYNSKEKILRLTRECLKIALKYKIPVSILTKSISVLDDLDVIKKFGNNIKIGMTLTFDNEKDSKEWEPEAASPKQRLEVLELLKNEGVKTWASFEPVIIPEQSINMIKKGIDFIDKYKIGKVNNFQGIDKKINWNMFLKNCVDFLRENKKEFYVKYDLREAVKGIELSEEEKDMDKQNLGKWI